MERSGEWSFFSGEADLERERERSRDLDLSRLPDRDLEAFPFGDLLLLLERDLLASLLLRLGDFDLERDFERDLERGDRDLDLLRLLDLVLLLERERDLDRERVLNVHYLNY